MVRWCHLLAPHPAKRPWVSYWCGGGAHGVQGIRPLGDRVVEGEEIETLSDLLKVTPTAVQTHSEYVTNLEFGNEAGAAPSVLDAHKVDRLVYFIPASLLSHTRAHHLLEGVTAFRQLLTLPYWQQGTTEQPREVWVVIEGAPPVHSSRFGTASAGYDVDYANSPETVWEQVVRGPALARAGYPIHVQFVGYK